MKRGIIFVGFFILFIFLIISFVSAQTCTDFGYNKGILGSCCDAQCTSYDLSKCFNTTSSSCNDFDGGKNYYNSSKAVFTGTSTYGKNCINFSQGTFTSQTTYLDKCNGNNLSEAFCSGNAIGTFTYVCPNGCDAGSCLNITAPTPPAKTCLDFGYNKGILGSCCDAQCASYDLSKCFNTTSSSCNDFDGGKDYYNSSKAIVSDSSIYGKNCNGMATGGGGSGGIIDTCNGDILTEAICSGNAIGTDKYTCPNSCQNGACILGTTAACTDTDALIETKEISSGLSKSMGCLNIKVDSTSSTNLGFAAKLIISKEGSSISQEIILSSLENNATAKISCGNAEYTLSLISASTSSATIKISNYLNYYTKGIASKEGGENIEDFCVNNIKLSEALCNNDGNPAYAQYNCPNVCEEGVCLGSVVPPQPNVCKPLLDYLPSISEIFPGYLFSKKDVDDGSQYNSEIGDNVTTAAYLFENKEKGKAIYVATLTTQNKNIALTEWFQRIKEETPFTGDYIQGNQVYLLKDRNEEAILWFNKNTVIIIAAGAEYAGYNKIIANVDDFIANLQDNEFESLFDYSSENYQILRKIALVLLPKCPSEISESCLSQWERKVEPAVCPEYGTQTIIVRDRYRCTDKIIKQTKTCSPGICSGCYIPRWLSYNFGYETEDNICIPYTIRMAYEGRQDTDRLYTDENHDEATLTCINDYTAKLNLISTNFNKEYILTEGSEYTIEEDYVGEKIRFVVKKINCYEGERNYADITLLANFNGYCDIDGLIKEQKTKDSKGGWAKCQNNYECDSNLCSGGECVEINDAIKKASTFKGLFIRVFCRLAHIFSEENYNVCIGNYLGYSPALDDWSTT